MPTDHRETTRRLRAGFERALGVPFVAPNRIERLLNGREIFPAMLDAIREARRTIDFETFVYWQGDVAREFACSLADAAHRGVQVRVLLDAIGSLPMPDEIRGILEESPVELLTFHPPSPLRFWEIDHRSHRKILVCDDEIAFTGGVGIAREWEGDARSPEAWRESHFAIRGRVVPMFSAAFTRHWLEAHAARGTPADTTLEVLNRDPPSAEGHPLGGTGLDDAVEAQLVRSTSGREWTEIRTLFATAIRLAQVRIRLATAYFVPGDDITELLCEAAGRGVDVQVMLPGEHVDHELSQLAGEAEYEELLDAGVTILRYQPTMLHVKTMTVDGVLSCVGSANFNMRSLIQDDEVVLNVLDPDFAETLDQDFEADRASCEVLRSSDGWARRSVLQKAGEWAAGLMRHEL